MKIPFLSKSEDRAPVRRAIEHAAQATGMSSYETAQIVSYFWEAVASEVARGHVVRLPGFGCFAPWLNERKSVVGKDPILRCVPKFSPARSFRNEVHWGAPPNRAGKRALTKHRENHSLEGPEERSGQRVFTSAAAFRKSISAQIAESREDRAQKLRSFP